MTSKERKDEKKEEYQIKRDKHGEVIPRYQHLDAERCIDGDGGVYYETEEERVRKRWRNLTW
jgi:hypothetical protein